jgi:signal peptidase II
VSQQPTKSALRQLPGFYRLLLTALLGLILDLYTKHLSVQVLSGGRSCEFLPGWLHFESVSNRGAVFGLGQGYRWIFIAVSLAAIVFVVYLYRRGLRRWWYDVTLGMLLAGILGNLYDRIFVGYVRDMIHALPSFFWGGTWVIPILNYPPVDRAYFPWVFNVADSLLCVSIGILLITGFFIGDEQQQPAKPA